MPRSENDIFKKYGDNEIFVLGDTDEERSRILYVRSGMTPTAIAKRLKEWGDVDIKPEKIKHWSHMGKWRKLRKDYLLSYDKKLSEEVAEKQAVVDADSQQTVRDTYAAISAELMNMIHQKIRFSTPSMGTAAILKPKDIKDLTDAMKNTAEVHFRALGIAEVSVVDPTVGDEGIRVLTKQDMKRLGIKAE